jgi:hypothetical protein
LYLLYASYERYIYIYWNSINQTVFRIKEIFAEMLMRPSSKAKKGTYLIVAVDGVPRGWKKPD